MEEDKFEEEKLKEDIDRFTNLDNLSIWILAISGIVILFSVFAPLIFTQISKSGIEFSETGQIGDTLSGLMSPFIAISGVLLTFLAFYIQFKANKLQRNQFKIELDEQRKQFKKTQFENQFYEMLRLHKENVDEIKIFYPASDRSINGRQVFNLMLKEFELCYLVAKDSFPDNSTKDHINEAYGVFFHGVTPGSLEKHAFFRTLAKIKSDHKAQDYNQLPGIASSHSKIDWKINLDYSLFDGYSSQLGHYYRHLFQTVKFVANQDESFIKYEDKRRYLRILRAQLSNQEQAMLFYNWLSMFGQQWENSTNKFFRDYRMIHNIYPELLIEDIDIESYFDLETGYRTEEGREKDPLFEFQSW